MTSLSRPLTRTLLRFATPVAHSSRLLSTTTPLTSYRQSVKPSHLGLSFGTGLAIGGLLLPSSPSPSSAANNQQKREYTISSPDEEQKQGRERGDVKGSSTIWRKASPAAMRRQTVTLVFLSSEGDRVGLGGMVKSFTGVGGTGRAEWQSYIAYFREAGYDALDLNIPPFPSPGTRTDELHSQLRLTSLQRLPVLFVKDGTSASDVVSQYILPSPNDDATSSWWKRIFSNPTSSRPAISGLIVLDCNSDTALKFKSNPNLNTLLVGAGATQDSKEAKVKTLSTTARSEEQIIKEIERWLIAEGYEG